jgi:hypothetical protein
MAERRMFAKTIIDSDVFLEMPLSTQSLYFHLSMRADDEGFINNPKKIQRMIGASDDDLRILIGKRFLIPFDSGIVVIKHWRIHNYIQSDRFKPTVYTEEREMLKLKKNKAYSLNVSTLDTECIQDGYSLETQDSIGKDSIDKFNNDVASAKQKPTRHKYGQWKHVLLSDEELNKLTDRLGTQRTNEMIERLDNYMESTGKRYKNFYQTILNWVKRDGEKRNQSNNQPKKGIVDELFEKEVLNEFTGNNGNAEVFENGLPEFN